ncbi:MAG: hypothetical protein CO098_17085 [Bacteroidetes bacterium CG_4_9_14_3_um_filter_41_19]|nr:MAG: hypothetical protein CO098_17085 [Bacteroidetes bacterium CG_4_9_14_3_um_filter_41_19]
MYLLSPPYNHILTAIFNFGMLISGGYAGHYSLKQSQLDKELANFKPDKIMSNVTVEKNSNNRNGNINKYVVKLDDQKSIKIDFNLQPHLTHLFCNK